MNEKSENEQLRDVIRALFNIVPYDYQLRFIKDCINYDRVACRACRQTGKTTALSIFALLFAANNPKTNILLVAPTDVQCSNIFNMIAAYVQTFDTKEKIIENLTMRSVILTNGSSIKAMTVGDKGLSIRGLTAHLLIIDEAAYIKESIYNEVLLPTILATNGKIIEISTPFGRSNAFYRHCHDENWHPHHIPWKTAVDEGHLDIRQIEDAKKNTTEMQFQTEYEALFVSDQTNYFPLDFINSCIDNDIVLLREDELV